MNIPITLQVALEDALKQEYLRGKEDGRKEKVQHFVLSPAKAFQIQEMIDIKNIR